MEVISNGWIKLHREILDHWVYDDPEKLKIWITLLSKASHKKRKVPINYQVIDIKPGELIFGTIKFAEAIGVSRDKLYKTVKMFEKDGMIEYDTTTYKNKFSIIRVLNWEKYQNQKGKCPTYQEGEVFDQTDSIRGSEGGSKEDKSRADGEHTESKTNKNVKNVKKVKNNSSSENDSDSQSGGDEFSANKKENGHYDYPEEFERIYNLYPYQRGNKLAGWRKWAATRRRGVPEEDLIQAVKAYAAKCKQEGTEEQWVMHIKKFFGPDRYYETYLNKNAGPVGEDKEKERLNAAKKRLEERAAKYE